MKNLIKKILKILVSYLLFLILLFCLLATFIFAAGYFEEDVRNDIHRSYENAIESLTEQKNYPLAVKIAKKWAFWDLTNPLPHTDLGELYYQMNDFEKAEKEFLISIMLISRICHTRPEELPVYEAPFSFRYLAKTYYQQKRYDDAIAILTELAENYRSKLENIKLSYPPDALTGKLPEYKYEFKEFLKVKARLKECEEMIREIKKIKEKKSR